MKRVSCIVVLCVLLQALPCGESFGWSAAGHRIVASIAWQRLSDEGKLRLLAVLKKHPRLKYEFQRPMNVSEAEYNAWIVTQAAVWPDLIRGRERWDRPTWHYINEPYFLSDNDRDALKGRLTVNVERKLPKGGEGELNVIQALTLCRRKLADGATSDEEKAVFVCWLMHLVGDVHQPLHSTALFSKGRFPKGDRGGNDVRTKQQRNLHRFWDGLLGGRISHRDVLRRSASLVLNDELKRAGAAAEKKLEFDDWVQESSKTARGFVYHPSIIAEVKAKESRLDADLASIDLSLAYRKRAGDIAQRRVVEAGFRLAAVLEELLKTDANDPAKK